MKSGPHGASGRRRGPRAFYIMRSHDRLAGTQRARIPRVSVVLLILLASTALSVAQIAPRQKFTSDVNDTTRSRPLKMVENSDWELLWKFEQEGVAKDLTPAGTVRFFYSPLDLAFTVVATGSVFNATNGQVLIHLTPATTATNGLFNWRLQVESPSNKMAFAFGTLQLIRDVSGGPSLPLPVTTNLDWTIFGQYLNTATDGPYRAGDNIDFTGNGDGSQTINANLSSALSNVFFTASNAFAAIRSGRIIDLFFPTNISFFVNDSGYLLPAATNEFASLVIATQNLTAATADLFTSNDTQQAEIAANLASNLAQQLEILALAESNIFQQLSIDGIFATNTSFGTIVFFNQGTNTPVEIPNWGQVTNEIIRLAGKQFTTQFTSNQSATGVFTFTHNLGQTGIVWSVISDERETIIPTATNHTENSVTLDLTGFHSSMTGVWHFTAVAQGGVAISPSSGAGAITNITDLSDVTILNPAKDHILVYDVITGSWSNAPAPWTTLITVYGTAGDSIPPDTTTLVDWGSAPGEVEDRAGEFNTNTFVPKISKWYWHAAQVRVDDIVDQESYNLRIITNGVLAIIQDETAARTSTADAVPVNAVLLYHDAGDSVQMFIRHSDAVNRNLSTTPATSYWSIKGAN